MLGTRFIFKSGYLEKSGKSNGSWFWPLSGFISYEAIGDTEAKGVMHCYLSKNANNPKLLLLFYANLIFLSSSNLVFNFITLTLPLITIYIESPISP